MRRLLVLCLVLLAAPLEAGQEWELISVTRGPTWEVNQAKGAERKSLGGYSEGQDRRQSGLSDPHRTEWRTRGRYFSVHLGKRPGYDTDRHLQESAEANPNTLPRTDSTHEFVSIYRAGARCV